MSEPQTLVRAIETVASGGSVVDPEVVEQLVKRTRADDPLSRLTERERSVLELMAQGYSNGGIAQTLFLGLKTVETHVRSILQKLDLEESPEHHRRVLAVLTLLGERDGPGRKGRIARRTAVIVAVVALSLWMEVAGFPATPATDRPEVSYTTLHAIVPLVFAACAGIAWRISPTRVPARLMIAFVVVWIPQSIYYVIGSIDWLWPIVRGVDLWWAVIAGILVLVYPKGFLSDRFDRWIAGIALVASVVNLLGVLLLASPDAVPCDCLSPNPYQVADAPAVFVAVDVGYRLVGVILALVIAGRLLVRWVRASVPARTVAFLMPLALFAWAITLAAQAVTYAAATTADTVLNTVSLIAIASIPVSFDAGVAHARNMRARVADLMRITREGADRGLWAESLARTLRDASVRVYWWDEEKGRYADASGAPSTRPMRIRGAATASCRSRRPSARPSPSSGTTGCSPTTCASSTASRAHSGSRSTMAGCAPRSSARSSRCASRASASSRLASRRGGASSATCTTAPSSTSSRSACDCASRPTRPATPTRCSSPPSSRAPSPC